MRFQIDFQFDFHFGFQIDLGIELLLDTVYSSPLLDQAKIGAS
jgi:hypothetical protein